MEPLEQQFHDARKGMITAFAELTTLACEAGVEWDAVTDLHGQFFDGNVEIKDAFARATFRARWSGRGV